MELTERLPARFPPTPPCGDGMFTACLRRHGAVRAGSRSAACGSGCDGLTASWRQCSVGKLKRNATCLPLKREHVASVTSDGGSLDIRVSPSGRREQLSVRLFLSLIKECLRDEMSHPIIGLYFRLVLAEFNRALEVLRWGLDGGVHP